MPTDLERLTTIRSQILANLEALTANPLPNYATDGDSKQWQSLFDSYINQLSKIDQQIASENGPFEVASEAST